MFLLLCVGHHLINNVWLWHIALGVPCLLHSLLLSLIIAPSAMALTYFLIRELLGDCVVRGIAHTWLFNDRILLIAYDYRLQQVMAVLKVEFVDRLKLLRLGPVSVLWARAVNHGFQSRFYMAVVMLRWLTRLLDSYEVELYPFLERHQVREFRRRTPKHVWIHD